MLAQKNQGALTTYSGQLRHEECRRTAALARARAAVAIASPVQVRAIEGSHVASSGTSIIRMRKATIARRKGKFAMKIFI